MAVSSSHFSSLLPQAQSEKQEVQLHTSLATASVPATASSCCSCSCSSTCCACGVAASSRADLENHEAATGEKRAAEWEQTELASQDTAVARHNECALQCLKLFFLTPLRWRNPGIHKHLSLPAVCNHLPTHIPPPLTKSFCGQINVPSSTKSVSQVPDVRLQHHLKKSQQQS